MPTTLPSIFSGALARSGAVALARSGVLNRSGAVALAVAVAACSSPTDAGYAVGVDVRVDPVVRQEVTLLADGRVLYSGPPRALEDIDCLTAMPRTCKVHEWVTMTIYNNGDRPLTYLTGCGGGWERRAGGAWEPFPEHLICAAMGPSVFDVPTRGRLEVDIWVWGYDWRTSDTQFRVVPELRVAEGLLPRWARASEPFRLRGR